ncbi:MAG: cation diffusion facilitator family transporter [Alphaproteobacteria bacterium]|nr:cation diffusion facilitator family transporter [Alphaproteobacteria bacterium]
MNSSKQNLLLKSASYFAVFNGIIIFLLKLYGYTHTYSASLFASLVDAGLDITSSFLNMIALRLALLPPDENHRFGHEKIQDLAAFGQGVFFVASSIFVLGSSVYKLGHDNDVTNPELGLVVMGISTFLTILLISYQTFVLSCAQSSLIKIDRFHYLSDLLTNLAVIISLYFSFSYKFVDGLVGVLISFYLIHGSYSIIQESLHHLLDEEASDEDKAKIIDILKKYKSQKQIMAMHDLKTRIAGNKYFIQFHIELDGNLKLHAIHAITENIEQDIIKIFPVAEIIIHQDPVGVDEDTPYRDELVSS